MNWDVVVVGAGPAGLTAALNLARARRRVLVLDSNRPRNSATFRSHGYLTRDGVSPLELRALGRAELEDYPEVEFRRTLVSGIRRDGAGFLVADRHGEESTATVLIATGLGEELPAVEGIRSYYGTSIHSCIACDAYEYADRPIALIGETGDLAERAAYLSQWSRDLVVFTNARGTVSAEEEDSLAARGIRVDRRPVAAIAGNREGVTGVTLGDGETVPRVAVFVRPRFRPGLDFLAGLALELDAEGLIRVGADASTSVPGLFAAGDCVPPGPQQLIVAAGLGALAADGINRHLSAISRP